MQFKKLFFVLQLLHGSTGILMVYRAVGKKIVASQTTVDKGRGGKISFIVKALHESIIVFAGPRKTCLL